MKIGIINFEVSPAGVNQLFEQLINTLTRKHSVTRIQVKEASLQFEDVKKEWDGSSPLNFNELVPVSPLKLDTGSYTSLKQFDQVIIAGPQRVLRLVEQLKKEIHNTKFLYIPVSIYNDIEETGLSMGYDTALNYIIESVLKIQDTVDSLKYPNPRLFGIQLTDKASRVLLEDAALALGAYPILSNWKSFSQTEFNTALKESISGGQTYYFVLFDETIDPEEIPGIVDSKTLVDWKWGQIDTALCNGPYPTAQDRLLAMQFASEALEWIGKGKPTGKLMSQNRNAFFNAL